MDFLSRKFKKILAYSGLSMLLVLGVAWIVFSCGGGSASHNLTQDSTQKDTLKVITANMPPRLEGFDTAFKGTIADLGEAQLNLRRYGAQLSGDFWAWKDTTSYTVKGNIEADGETMRLNIYQPDNTLFANINGKLRNDKIEGEWNNPSQKTAPLAILLKGFENKAVYRVKIDDIEINKTSSNSKQNIRITFPVLQGITDPQLAVKVNRLIETYFEANTLMDSINIAQYPFREDVKFEVTLLTPDFISISKHHHLSKNEDTQLFDDSHGININFKRAKQYELRDLFNENFFEQLNALIHARINKSCGGMLNEAQLKTCSVQPEEKTSFSLSKDKITFHLTERLPHKMRGCGYVRISYKDLEEFFNLNGPLASIVPNQ